jgi:nitrile hydratase
MNGIHDLGGMTCFGPVRREKDEPIFHADWDWCKDAAYRSRIVIDPRGMLREFGTRLDDDVEVCVWDSSAEVRYLVLPQRPAGTDDLSESKLAELVHRDVMIGVTQVASP